MNGIAHLAPDLQQSVFLAVSRFVIIVFITISQVDR
jgi:hypothetical protein